MFDLHCPKCGSSRIHRGYSEAPFYKRIFGFQNLLCNGCNLLFTAFAWPGTVQRQSRRKRKEEEKPVAINTPSTRTALDLLPELEARQKQEAERIAEAQEAGPPVLEKVVAQPLAVAAGSLPGRVVLPEPQSTIPAPVKPQGGTLENKPPAVSSQSASFVLETKVARKSSRPRQEKTEPQRQPGILDYTRFGVYYAGLYLKSKIGVRPTSHSMEMSFRWRNWWHWQRAKKEARHE